MSSRITAAIEDGFQTTVHPERCRQLLGSILSRVTHPGPAQRCQEAVRSGRWLAALRTP
jgi:hypothetical protein